MSDGWRGIWWGRGPGVRSLRALLLPLEGLYRLAVFLRNRAYDRGLARTEASPIPVVSVGNLTVGGSGKTPVAAWVARSLADRGVTPALVTRGYGQDEVDLHARWNPDVPVVVAPRRAEGIRQAARDGAAVAVLDDGFQHRRAARDLDVVVMAAEEPFPGPLLPRGPYREPPSALGRAGLALITVKTAPEARVDGLRLRIRNVRPNLPVAVVRLSPAGWATLAGEPAPPPAPPLLAVASTATPGGFVRTVAAATGGEPELLAFRDHHDYGAADVERIRSVAGDRCVVTTEKDAVKLEAFQDALGPVRVLRLQVRPDALAVPVLARALDGTLGSGALP